MMKKIDETYILIAGCGVSGQAAARLAARLNLPFALLDEKKNDALLHFYDSLPVKPKETFWGADQNTPLPHFSSVVLSPGFRRSNPLFHVLVRHADCVTTELEFALSYCGKDFLAVTGTNGKTTTTELTAELCRAAGVSAKACGNNGYAMSDAVIDVLNGNLDLPVVEVSSFQLENMKIPRPVAAAVLNIASDHIDRHGCMDDYARAKFKLLQADGVKRILNTNVVPYGKKFLPAEKNNWKTFSSQCGSADFFCDGTAVFHHGRKLLDVSELKLKGVHNMENAMAALALVESYVNDFHAVLPSVLESLRNFSSGPHRLELFHTTADGIRFVNDSKATNPHAVNAALKTLGGFRQCIVLWGGLDKQMDFTELRVSASHVKHAFLFGSCAGRIKQAVSDVIPCTDCQSFEDAVRSAIAMAETGDTVVLSPATASMDLFKDYRERGNQFKQLCLSCLHDLENVSEK